MLVIMILNLEMAIISAEIHNLGLQHTFVYKEGQICLDLGLLNYDYY